MARLVVGALSLCPACERPEAEMHWRPHFLNGRDCTCPNDDYHWRHVQMLEPNDDAELLA
jgi:hypothetical protein